MITALTRQQTVAVVTGNKTLCTDHFRLVLRVDSFPPTEPGHFIELSCNDIEETGIEAEIDWPADRLPMLQSKDWTDPPAMLRRPFSLAGRRDLAGGGVELDVIHRVIGTGTAWLARRAIGDRVGVLGPLGNIFTLPSQNQTALLIGGGVGIPPMLYLAEALAGRQAVAFCGATRRDLLPLDIQPDGQAREFSRFGHPSVLTTDDGSLGRPRFVTDALIEWLDADETRARSAVLYTCGPEGMMKRIAEIARERNLRCEVAIERAMACGMGTCQSCVIRRKSENHPAGWTYALACTHGPIFQADQLLW